MVQKNLLITLLTLVTLISGEHDDKVFKMCSSYLTVLSDFCVDLVNQKKPQLECIQARDHIECLELIKRNEADIMVVFPEDIYIAEQMDNDKFRIIAEIRYHENDEVEEEDQILIKKSSTIKSLKDLKGSKSCHPGFDSYYGYQIPIAVLIKNDLIQVSKEPTIPVQESELKALSEFFKQSCIVSSSEDESFNPEWKKKYSNLCQLCSNPIDCDENDEYAYTDGAIKCLINGKGDIAFTSKSEIQEYFGLINKEGNKDVNVNDYELLCEDGSRKPINGTGCSLAKRPNVSFITTSNIADNQNLLNSLLLALKTFYKNLREHLDTQYDDIPTSLHLRSDSIAPKDYLIGFKVYIEGYRTYRSKVKLCVTSDIELDKCKVLTKAAFANYNRPEIECYLSEKYDCAADVANDKADIAIVPGYNWTMVENTFSNLKPVAYEDLDFNEMYIAQFNSVNSLEDVFKFPIKFNKTDKRAFKAACLLHLVLGNKECENLDGNIEGENYIEIVTIGEGEKYNTNKDLLCLNKTRSNFNNFWDCNLDLYSQNAVYVNGNKSQTEIDSYKNVIIEIGEEFHFYNNDGTAELKNSHIFHLFSPFKEHKNVLFNDNSLNLNGTRNFDNFPKQYYELFQKIKAYN